MPLSASEILTCLVKWLIMGSEKQIDIKGDDELLEVLKKASSEDLDLLVDYITDSGNGRLSLSAAVCKTLTNAKAQGTYSPSLLRQLIRELQLFGGNSIVNLFRSSGISYREIVFDVAEHLAVKRLDDESLADIERNILIKMWNLTVNDTGEADRRALIKSIGEKRGSFATADELQAAFNLGPGSISITAASLLSKAMAANTLGSSVTAGMTLAAGRSFTAALGPIGVALSGVWGAYSLTAPAYRITVPCVVQIAFIRLKQTI